MTCAAVFFLFPLIKEFAEYEIQEERKRLKRGKNILDTLVCRAEEEKWRRRHGEQLFVEEEFMALVRSTGEKRFFALVLYANQTLIIITALPFFTLFQVV